ncbi:hypothetical protein OPV22_008366 [Ensete ventricosum]|uniref:Uncharacterized protein n=1 Tax=Ensete ventricosum TaxID=4639 RepID=A0AAV8PPK2_ENSVE|nr:hypothetical protein OPV22_008366 [Ensete ventricosum]
MDLSRRAEAEAMRYSPMSKSSPHFVKVFLPDPCSQHLCWCLMQLHAKRRWLSLLGLAVEMWPPSIGSCLARRQLSLIGPACKTLILFNVNVDEKEVKDLKALVLSPVDDEKADCSFLFCKTSPSKDLLQDYSVGWKWEAMGGDLCTLQLSWRPKWQLGAFSFAHNMENYDVCIFEPIKRIHLKVHIFRVVNEITPLIRNCKRNSP